MAFILRTASVTFLLSLFAVSFLVYCATADNKTNQPSYKVVSYMELRYVQMVISDKC